MIFNHRQAIFKIGYDPRTCKYVSVSDRITRGRNAIFGHVARLLVNTPAHQAKSSYRSVDPQTLHGNVHQVDHVPNGPTNSAAITTMSPLRLCGGKPLVAVTRERRYGPSRLRVKDDDDMAKNQGQGWYKKIDWKQTYVRAGGGVIDSIAFLATAVVRDTGRAARRSPVVPPGFCNRGK